MYKSKKLELILERFPKQRPVLPKSYEKIYQSEYKLNRDATEGHNIKAFLEEWAHKEVALTKTIIKCPSILEIGAGTLNHIKWEDEFRAYDIVEPMSFLYHDSQYLNRVDCKFKSVSEIPSENKYDKILSMYTLEHIENLPLDIAVAATHLKKGGVFIHGLPCEGRLLWGLAWRLTTGVSFRIRRNLSYKTLMRHEHLNSLSEIITVLSLIFSKVEVKYFPLTGLFGGLYAVVNCQHPRTEILEGILKYYDNKK